MITGEGKLRQNENIRIHISEGGGDVFNIFLHLTKDRSKLEVADLKH